MSRTPAQAWSALLEGNARFVSGAMEHPSQGVDHRAELSVAQAPFAVVFGCSDSRVAAEIIFDRGLGDLFVVRTAGHVVDTTVLGSIEYGVDVLGASLVVVLGHDSCGAVGAAAQALTTGVMPTGFVRAVVDRVIPSIVDLPSERDGDAAGTRAAGRESGEATRVLVPSAETLGREHIRHTVDMLLSYSASLRASVAAGTCAVVGVEYTLAEGSARLLDVRGQLA